MATTSILSGAGLSGAPLAASGAAGALGQSQNGKPGAAGGKTMTAKEAATQFEGLLIEEMLRSAHESSPGSLGGDDEADAQNDNILDMATQQLAQVIAKQGGFGIAKVVEAGITRQQASIDATNDAKHAAAPNALPK
jgi:Rod binding domain-containing protein